MGLAFSLPVPPNKGFQCSKNIRYQKLVRVRPAAVGIHGDGILRQYSPVLMLKYRVAYLDIHHAIGICVRQDWAMAVMKSMH
jgi:hypothetical protein